VRRNADAAGTLTIDEIAARYAAALGHSIGVPDLTRNSYVDWTKHRPMTKNEAAGASRCCLVPRLERAPCR
jgi:hypothetical protein